MKKKISAVTFHYMIITGGFWMAFCVVTAYAAVFLHGAGYDDQELGIDPEGKRRRAAGARFR